MSPRAEGVPTARRMGLPGLAVALAGCATVSITDPSGATRVERHAGVLGIHLEPGPSAVLVESSSLGYQSGPLGTSLGLGHARLAVVPEGCHLVLWLEHPEQAEELGRLLAGRQDLCFINALQRESKP